MDAAAARCRAPGRLCGLLTAGSGATACAWPPVPKANSRQKWETQDGCTRGGPGFLLRESGRQTTTGFINAPDAESASREPASYAGSIKPAGDVRLWMRPLLAFWIVNESLVPMQTESRRPAVDFAGRLTEAALGYQRMLNENPRQPEALVGITLVALASQQTEAAVKMARAAVSAAPKMGVAWVALGQALKAAGQAQAAEKAYRKAIALDGVNAQARTGLGELRLAAGQPEEAMPEFQLALRRQPSLVAAHFGLGNACALLGKDREALCHYEHALAFDARLPEVEFAAGFVLARMGGLKQAEIRYRRAVAMRPDFAAAWVNLGALLRELGREVYAEAALKRAVELRPEMISGWVDLALLEREQHRPEEAEIHLRRAFALDPGRVETLVAWSQFRAAENDLAGAWEWLRWALDRDPWHTEAINMYGILLHKDGRLADAAEVFARAETLGSKVAASNRGNSLLEMGRLIEALRAHEKAVDDAPESAGAHYNLALTRLRLGDWERGWGDYEARWHFREVFRAPRVFPCPRWRGEPLHGRRILLHAEQGLGDTIQFCRYATLVAARGGAVILQVQQAVARLMASLPVAQAGLAAVARLGERPPAFDLECPLMSLPAVFGTTTETAPWPGPYLGADAVSLSEKHARWANLGEGPRVGLAWAGNPGYKADRQRSTTLANLLPLFETPGTHWISLQKGAPAGQLHSLPPGITVWDGCSQDRDLAETAALVAILDLVITTDTSIAHLAGAMGKPVWILLPYRADWRWMEQTETTPWYPTARLFRQRTPGDWAGLARQVSQELGRFRWPRHALHVVDREENLHLEELTAK